LSKSDQKYMVVSLRDCSQYALTKSSSLPGNAYWRERLSTVELLIKVTCFAKKVLRVCTIKSSRSKLLSRRRSIGTEPSPSVRVPLPYSTTLMIDFCLALLASIRLGWHDK
jgi:hypothetical protein